MDLLRSKMSILLLLCASVPGFSATFIGRVLSDKGRPVGNVKVSVQATVAAVSSGATVQPTSYYATTDGQGVFSVALPSNGIYSVCVGSPERQLLNSCEWNLPQSIVQVGAQQSAIQVMTLETGIPVNIRLDDPNSLLPKPGLSGNASVSFIALEANGHSHWAGQLSADDKGFNYQMLVPIGANSLRFSVQAQNVHVADQHNTIVDGAISAQAILSDLSQVLHYQVVPTGN